MQRGRHGAATMAVALLATGLVATAGGSQAAAADVGFVGPSYDGVSAPTAEKPQSKLWHHDGRWWGVLFDRVTDDWTIHRFDWPTKTWASTGTFVENRNATHADALWDGAHLYVATGLRPGASSSDSSVRLLRYSYDSAQGYRLDGGFPVALYGSAVEAVVIDKDTRGVVWATFTASSGGGGRSVYVTHSTTSDAAWTEPSVLPGAGTSNLSSDDISAIVAFRSQIGVMWSNQNEDSVYFAVHRDGDPDTSWKLSPALQGPEYADDHINLKSLQAGPDGEVLAAVKTSLNAPDAPLTLLLVLREGSWVRHTFGRVADNHTRPIVLVDDENRDVYVLAASPCCSGGSIYLKQAPLNHIAFPTGLGTPFISNGSHRTINNPTSTKQAVNSRTGLLVLAGDDGTHTYLFNTRALSSSTATPDTSIDSGPSGVVPVTEASFAFSSTDASAGFECQLDAAPFSTCTSPKGYQGLAEGSHSFAVRAVGSAGNVDPTPATRAWTVDVAAPSVAGTSPADGAIDVDPAVAVEATFSEAVDPATVTGSTFGLDAAGNAQPVAASVEYDATARTARLRPASPLAVDVAHTATVVGGTGGVKDTAGRPLAADHTWSFRTAGADTTPPDTSFGAGPTGTVPTSTATFDFSSSETGSTFECRLDGGAFDPCVSPHTLVDLPDGPHSFEVRAVDGASNVDPSPAARDWVVDALVFADGFESGGLSGWEVRTGGDGTAAVQSEVVRTGGYAARLRATTASGSYSYLYRALGPARTELTVSANFLVREEGGNGKTARLLSLRDAEGEVVSVERVNGSGALILRQGAGRSTLSGSIPRNAWARLLVRVVIGGSGTGTVEVRLDGTLVFRTTTATLATSGITRVDVGSSAKRQAFDTVVDDVTVRG